MGPPFVAGWCRNPEHCKARFPRGAEAPLLHLIKSRVHHRLVGPGIVVGVKAKFDDHVITVRSIEAPDGTVLPPGSHGFVIEAFGEPHEHYEVEFDPEQGDQILMIVGPDDFAVA